jgi:DNA-binding transcriptional LysR family regulator
LIATGRYIGFLPRSAAQLSSRVRMKILPVMLADQRTAVGVITMKNRTLSPLAGLFVDCARQVVKPLQR